MARTRETAKVRATATHGRRRLLLRELGSAGIDGAPLLFGFSAGVVLPRQLHREVRVRMMCLKDKFLRKKLVIAQAHSGEFCLVMVKSSQSKFTTMGF
jgi:hypothetical protein